MCAMRSFQKSVCVEKLLGARKKKISRDFVFETKFFPESRVFMGVSMESQNLTALDALEKLKEGNKRYLNALTNPGDISQRIRHETCENGQKPYAVVITCADSRVIPEGIFSTGIGELFVIRVAGNVIGAIQLGSVEYAVEHLGSPLVVVMGHTHCGAVGAAVNSDPEGFVKSITDAIRKAIGNEKNELVACKMNVKRSVNIIKANLKTLLAEGKMTVVGAVYDIDSGEVEFLD